MCSLIMWLFFLKYTLKYLMGGVICVSGKVCIVFYLGFDDGKDDDQLRMYAVRSYLALLEEGALYPQKFLQVMSWVRSKLNTQI